MLLSYSDLQGNHHDDADNYEFTMMAMITMMVVVTTMTLKWVSTVVVELGREPFELHLFQKSFIQGGQIQCCYNHDMKTTTMMNEGD